MIVYFAGQNAAKQQFQINLISFTDPIDVLLVNKDADADKPSITPVPPLQTDSSSASHNAVVQTSDAMPHSSQSGEYSYITI